jgi:hypothetical protein
VEVGTHSITSYNAFVFRNENERNDMHQCLAGQEPAVGFLDYVREE